MAEEQTTTQRTDTTASPYRIDVKLHEILMEPSGETQAKETPQPESPGLKLPEYRSIRSAHTPRRSLPSRSTRGATPCERGTPRESRTLRRGRSRTGKSFVPSSRTSSRTISAIWIVTTAGPTTTPSRA